jgi:hypothetical protein
MNEPRLIEIRSYQLKPGAADDFHHQVRSAAVPMLKRWGMDVVAFGPSAHEPNSYFLVRAYADLADLQAQQDAFYGSDAWKQGPRPAIIGGIESYLNTLLWLTPAAIDDMRRLNSLPG